MSLNIDSIRYEHLVSCCKCDDVITVIYSSYYNRYEDFSLIDFDKLKNQVCRQCKKKEIKQ